MNTTSFKVNPDDLEVRIERVFDAPIEDVWNAHVDPQKVAQWWGPRQLETRVESLDVFVGGAWRILHKESGGREHWFRGTYEEVTKPEKFVRTFIYEPAPEHVMIETCLFEAQKDGSTRLTAISKFPSKEALDAMVNSGMEYGSRESFDRLSELLENQ